MKRFILLTILCCLVLSISAQIARDEIFEDIHRSAANHYAYPDPHFTMTAPPKGYKPFYLSHYARHGSRYRVNPDDYTKPLAILREAEKTSTYRFRQEGPLACRQPCARSRK